MDAWGVRSIENVWHGGGELPAVEGFIVGSIKTNNVALALAIERYLRERVPTP